MDAVYYYSSILLVLSIATKDTTTQITALALGLHLLIAPFIREIGQYDFFWFYAVWDMVGLLISLFIDSIGRKLLLVLIFALSSYINCFNALLWEVKDLMIYNYYHQINVFLLESTIAIIASTIVGKSRRWVVFGSMTVLFIIFRTHI